MDNSYPRVVFGNEWVAHVRSVLATNGYSVTADGTTLLVTRLTDNARVAFPLVPASIVPSDADLIAYIEAEFRDMEHSRYSFPTTNEPPAEQRESLLQDVATALRALCRLNEGYIEEAGDVSRAIEALIDFKLAQKEPK